MSGYVFDDGLFGDPQCVSCSSKYGYGATSDYLGGGCKCMSGYIMGKDFLGKPSCVSENEACKDQYGYNARSTYGGKCECSYGYVFGKDSIGRIQCISTDSACNDQLGYNSKYNSLSDKCECSYGYELSLKSGGGLNCVYCSTKYGTHSSYDSSSKKCECDDGYTLDNDSQCVEKQNNVYFTLKELNTDEKKAIVKSDYDYRYYLISYNSGCYSSSFKRYLGHKIVINLGTDFYLDTWDNIVLQDDNETCDIAHKEYANSSTTLEPEEELSYNFIPAPATSPAPTQIIKTPIIPESAPAPIIKAEPESSKTDAIKRDISTTPASEKMISPEENSKSEKNPGFFNRMFGSIKNFFSGIFR